MSTECGIVRDLLPLYADNLTNSISNELVRSHLEACSSCRAGLQQLVQQQSMPESEQALQWDSGKEGRVYSKVRRRVIRTLSVLIITAIVLGAVVGLFGTRLYDHLMYGSIEPHAEQHLVAGTIEQWGEVNVRVDGTTVLYTVVLAGGKTAAVTKHTKLYQMKKNGQREEIHIEQLRQGQQVQLWERLANNHLLETVELTVVE